MQHSLLLQSQLDASAMNKLVATLHTLDGVAGVRIPADGRSLDVDYDADLTSPQELEAVAARAGHPSAAPLRHGHGSCCGGCGG